MCDVVTGAESSHEPLDTDGSLILHQPDYIEDQSFSLWFTWTYSEYWYWGWFGSGTETSGDRTI